VWYNNRDSRLASEVARLNRNVSILGAGRVGQSIARLLSLRGYRIDTLISRNWEHAQQAALFVGTGRASTVASDALDSELVFVTTPDDQIAEVVNALTASGRLNAHHTIIHCSGALDLESLQPAKACGARVLSIHPMQAVAGAINGVALLPGSYFGIEAQPEDLPLARCIVEDLGGKPLELHPGMKSLYHAGAVFASNYVVVLLAMACDMLEKVGIERKAAMLGLVSLATGAVQNVKDAGLPQALTGPIERGDVHTVVKHLTVLADEPEFINVYRTLGKYAVQLAKEKHPHDYDKLDAVLSLINDVESKEG
jgi:predicted short-subunit dehydrogenase-like oxidoreductase (DUF2520 family)